MKKKFTVHIMKKTEKVSIKPLYTITDAFLDPTTHPKHFFTDKRGKVVCSADLIHTIIAKAEATVRTNEKLRQPFYSAWVNYITFKDSVVTTKDTEYDPDELQQQKNDQKPHNPVLDTTTIDACQLSSFVIDHYNISGQNIDDYFEKGLDAEDQLEKGLDVEDRSKRYFSIGRDAFIKQSPKLIATVKKLLCANFNTAANPIFECGELDDFAVFARVFTLYSISAKSHERISIPLLHEVSPLICKREFKKHTHYPDYITDGTLSSSARAIDQNKAVMDAGVNVHVVTAHETLDASIYQNEAHWVDGIDRLRKTYLNTEITVSDLLSYISDYLYPEQQRPDVKPITLTDYGDSSDSDELTNHTGLRLSDSQNVEDDEIITNMERKQQQISKLWDRITLCINNQSDFEERIWMPAIQNDESMAIYLKSGNCTFGNLLKNDDSSLTWNKEGVSYLADFFRHFLIFLGEKKLEKSLIGGIFKHLKMFNEIKSAENKQQPLYKINDNRTKEPTTDEELKTQADSFRKDHSLYRKIISALFTQLCTLA